MYDKKENSEKIYHSPKVISRSIKNAGNTPQQIKAIETEVVSNIPIILTKFTIQLNVDCHILLPGLANSIESIKNRVKVTQCMMLQDYENLFIEGVIYKNIYFIEAINNKLLHHKMNIPFECKIWGFLHKFQSPFINLKNFDDTFSYNVVSNKMIESCKYIYDDQKGQDVKVLRELDPKKIKGIDDKMIMYLVVQILKNCNVTIPICSGEKHHEKMEEADQIQEKYEKMVKHDDAVIEENQQGIEEYDPVYERKEREKIEVPEVQMKENEEENSSTHKPYWQIRCYPCCAKHYPYHYEMKCKKRIR